MTGVACSAMVDMISFSFSPTSVYTVGISDEIAQLPMFSGFLFRLVLLIIANIIMAIYVLRYARGVKSGKITSLTADLDDSKFRIDYSETLKDPLNKRQSISLVVFLVTFVASIVGVSTMGWSMNDLSACFLFTAIAAGLINRIPASKLVNVIIAGAKDGLAPALVIGLARGIQWILTASAIIDPIINSISKPLMAMPKYLTPIAVMIVIALFNGLITSGSAKAMALMPILIPLADVLGVTRQTTVLAFNFGDGFCNYILPTSTALMGTLSVTNIPYDRWMRFMWKLFVIWQITGCVMAFIAQLIHLGPM